MTSNLQKSRKQYQHSVYWYARHSKKRRSDRSFATEYLAELCEPYHRTGSAIYDGTSVGTGFNPLLFGLMIVADIGNAIENSVRNILDPEERARMKRELMRDLRIARRPFYYARERERRRQLAAERRKVKRRTTLAPCPTPEQMLAAWKTRKESKENMIVLGGMLQDLECYVDNTLRFDEYGNVVGRNGGIRGWLAENLPDLLHHYKTLMRYKAMTIRLRQATGTQDPTPTAALLVQDVTAHKTPTKARLGQGAEDLHSMPDARPLRQRTRKRHEVVEAILADPRPTFASILEHLAHRLDLETVFTEAPTTARSGKAAAKLE